MADPRRLSVTMSRDTWLLLLGWLAAKRPETDWDPGFLTAVIETISGVVNDA